MSGQGDDERLLAGLEDACAKLDVAIRREPLDAASLKQGRGGGLVTLRGHKVIFLDARLSIAEQSAVITEALAAMDLESVYLPPRIREHVRTRHAASLEPRPLRKARPANDE